MDVQLDEEHSIHDVAALLKEFLRDMPDPLLTKELYTAFINTTCRLSTTFLKEPIILIYRLFKFIPIFNLFGSAGFRRAAQRHPAPGLPAPSMQQRHPLPPPAVPLHCDRPRPRQAGQRRAGGERQVGTLPHKKTKVLVLVSTVNLF